MKFKIGDVVYHKTSFTMRWIVMEVRLRDISTEEDMMPVWDDHEDSVTYVLRGCREVLSGGSVMHRITAQSFELTGATP